MITSAQLLQRHLKSGNDGCAGGPNHGFAYSPLPGTDPVRAIAEAKQAKRGKRG
jgi:hypothetical protein